MFSMEANKDRSHNFILKLQFLGFIICLID